MTYDCLRSGKGVFVHTCGNIQLITPDLAEIGVEGLNSVQPECMDLSKLKEKYGHKITFWGGISTQRTLPYGSVADVKYEALLSLSSQ